MDRALGVDEDITSHMALHLLRHPTQTRTRRKKRGVAGAVAGPHPPPATSLWQSDARNVNMELEA